MHHVHVVALADPDEEDGAVPAWTFRMTPIWQSFEGR